MMGRATKFTGAGAIATGDITIRRLVVTPAAAAAVVDIKEGGTGGTVVLSIQAAANGNSQVIEGPILIRDPFISSLTGAGASLTVVM